MFQSSRDECRALMRGLPIANKLFLPNGERIFALSDELIPQVLSNVTECCHPYLA
jgi:hypothetical protein